jgi:hypothetical protein
MRSTANEQVRVGIFCDRCQAAITVARGREHAACGRCGAVLHRFPSPSGDVWASAVDTLAVEEDRSAAESVSRGIRRQRRLAGVVLAVLVLTVLSVCLFSCSHQSDSAPAAVTVLADRVGGPAAEALGVLTGQEPRAATLPYVGTIVFQTEDADDTCLLAHEARHRTDMAEMGPGRWVATYLHQLGACERDLPRAECLRSIPLEARAYEVQHACQRARAGL